MKSYSGSAEILVACQYPGTSKILNSFNRVSNSSLRDSGSMVGGVALGGAGICISRQYILLWFDLVNAFTSLLAFCQMLYLIKDLYVCVGTINAYHFSEKPKSKAGLILYKYKNIPGNPPSFP